MTERTRYIGALYFVQVLANILILGAIIVLLVLAIGRISRVTSTQTKANRELITEIRRILTIHADASAKRSCAVAKEIRYVVLALSPRRQPLVIQQTLADFVGRACHVEILVRVPANGSPPPTPHPSSPSSHPSSPSSHPSTPTPHPSPSSSPPTPHPSPSSPSPTIICLPVVGCI